MPRAEVLAEASAPLASALLAGAGQTLSIGTADVTAWLAAHGLRKYAEPLIAAGYEEVVLFRGMTEAEEGDLIAEHKMPRPHARALKAAVRELRLHTGSSLLSDSMEAGVAVVHAEALRAEPAAPDTPVSVPHPTAAGQAGGQPDRKPNIERVGVADGVSVTHRRHSDFPHNLSSTTIDDSRREVARRSSAPRARKWALLLFCGAVIQQAGWWSFYGVLALWCGLVGGAMVLTGAIGFDCGTPVHSGDWLGGGKEWRNGIRLFLCFYAVLGALATGVSAKNCPDDHDGCVLVWVFAPISLFLICSVLCMMHTELGAMKRGY